MAVISTIVSGRYYFRFLVTAPVADTGLCQQSQVVVSVTVGVVAQTVVRVHSITDTQMSYLTSSVNRFRKSVSFEGFEVRRAGKGC